MAVTDEIEEITKLPADGGKSAGSEDQDHTATSELQVLSSGGSLVAAVVS